MIKRRKAPDSRIERQIATGMIVSESFLKELIPIFRQDSLMLPYAKAVANWCIEYYNEYQEAPGRHIQDLFLAHKDDYIDPDQFALIETFLAGLSDEYEKAETFNVEYILKKTEFHFRKQSLDTLKNNLAQSIASGRVEEAEALIGGFDRIARPKTVGVNPISDTSVIANAFDESSGDRMFSFAGDLGRMLGSFERGMLAMIVGPMGRGKTWWLQEITLRGLFAGFNVLFVSLEMSEKQMVRRLHHGLSALPKKKWAGNMLIPVFDCELNQTNKCKNRERTCRVGIIDSEGEIKDFDSVPDEYEVCTACRDRRNFVPAVWYKEKKKKVLETIGAIQKGRALERTLLRGNRFKLINPPPGTLNIAKLETMLDNWEYYEGWIPDVIVTDYADKFAPEDKFTQEYRHRVYQTVVAHKALGLKRNCLVASASQSNTGRDDNKKVRSGDFAEDIRKKAEVDIAFSLNQTAEQKEQNVMMISPMKIRDEDFSTLQECMVLQQLKIGKPYLDSYLR